MTALYVLTWLAVSVLLLGVIARIIRILRMPLHLRWELYPVPHERGRAHYGGSRLEDVNWWTKQHNPDHVTELWTMLKEILLLKGVWEHNRPLWWGSFALHFALYLLIGVLALAVIGGIMVLTGSPAPPVLFAVIKILAWVAYSLGMLGALIMLWKRLLDPKLKLFTTGSHVFNLILLGAIDLTGLIWMIRDSEYAVSLTGFLAGLVTPTQSYDLSTVGYWHVSMVLLFFVYFPFTHMTHAFVKYFTYHSIRWEDTPNLPGGRLQAQINRLEGQVVTWAAPHINADGRKTWVDLVGETGEEKP
jgi:nitrate reductase gamma subunit